MRAISRNAVNYIPTVHLNDGYVLTRSECEEALRLMDAFEEPPKWKPGQRVVQINDNVVLRLLVNHAGWWEHETFLPSQGRWINNGARLNDGAVGYVPWPRVGDWVRIGHNGHAFIWTEECNDIYRGYSDLEPDVK